MVTQLNCKTKKAQAYIDRYAHSLDFELYHVYKKLSAQNLQRFDRIRHRADVLATTLKVIGASSYYFTVAYCVKSNTPQLAVQTASNIYTIPLTQDDIEHIAPYHGWNPYK